MPVTVRPARPSDDAAPLLYASASGVYDLMFGGPEPALRALRRIYPSPGAAMSWEACLVAELDGSLAGVLAGYPLEEGAAQGVPMQLGTEVVRLWELAAAGAAEGADHTEVVALFERLAGVTVRSAGAAPAGDA